MRLKKSSILWRAGRESRCRRQPPTSRSNSWREVRRHAPMPVGRLLIAMRDIQDLCLGKSRALNLQADWQPFAIEAARNRNGRGAGQVACDRENIVEVHF